ncbi:hypothetical protein T09_8330 [Trichinella sp. T9]|nr:hypothetical protein T09_13325 [Trichinella sp. T9]KRX55686.1 hypothetical protein T09_8330 [Trichinella sp. T9]
MYISLCLLYSVEGEETQDANVKVKRRILGFFALIGLVAYLRARYHAITGCSAPCPFSWKND